MKVLVQLPSVVQPPPMSVFMETEHPYSLHKADLEVTRLIDSFSKLGIENIFLSDALFNEISPNVPMKDMLELAQRALNFDENVSEDRKLMAYEHLTRCNRKELAEIIINQPKLRLHHDEELGRISPDSTYESYEINPLFGLLFPRDHFINVGGNIIFGRLKRSDRAREVDVVKKIMTAHNYQFTEVDWVIEGGDYHENEKVSIINFGFRTDGKTLQFLLDSGFIKTDTVLAIKDKWHNPEQFHLDHYVCLLRNNILIDSYRANFCDRSCVQVYRRTPENSWVVDGGYQTIQQAAEMVGLKPILLDGEMMADFCANSLSVDNQIWINENAPRALIEELLSKGYNVHRQPFSEHQKQFGGIHCSTQFI